MAKKILLKDQNGDIIYPVTRASDIAGLNNTLANKQDKLVSGTNIKTLNNNSILGEGNIELTGGGNNIELNNNLMNIVEGTNISIQANPTEAGTTNLTKLKVGETIYNVATGGGLPEGTAAGQALVFNGTEWQKQAGYGYDTISGTGIKNIWSWNGNTAGLESVNLGDDEDEFRVYKISSDIDSSITAQDALKSVRAKIILQSGSTTETGIEYLWFDPEDPEEIVFDGCFIIGFDGMPLIFVTKDEVVLEETWTFTRGVWAGKWLDDEDEEAEWVSEITLGQAATELATWDGVTTGKETRGSIYCKIAEASVISTTDILNSDSGYVMIVDKRDDNTEKRDLVCTDLLPETSGKIYKLTSNSDLLYVKETIDIEGLTFIPGIWAKIETNYYVKKLVVFDKVNQGAVPVTYQIDSKFIPHDSTKQNTLTAGSGITINNNVISATAQTIPWIASGEARYIEDSQIKTGSAMTQTGTTTTQDSGWVQPKADGRGSAAFGRGTVAGGQENWVTSSVAIDNNNHDYAFAANKNTRAFGDSSAAFNRGSIARGANSFAEGESTQANGKDSHAEGYGSIAYDKGAHAEGYYTEAHGDFSHAEGSGDTNGLYAHAEGNETKAQAEAAHSEGRSTEANSKYSHAEGFNTKATGEAQHVQGKYNIADTTSAFIIGNGTSDSNRSNALTVDWNGALKCNKLTDGTTTKTMTEMLNVQGLSDGTQAGQTHIWNGTSWQKQAGYGYDTFENVKLEWDGVQGDKPIKHISGETYICKIANPSTLPTKENFIGKTYVYVSSTTTITDDMCTYIEETDELRINTSMVRVYYSGEDRGIWVRGTDLSSGTYIYHIEKLNYNGVTSTQQINSKFIPHDSTKQDTLTAGAGIAINNNTISSTLTNISNGTGEASIKIGYATDSTGTNSVVLGRGTISDKYGQFVFGRYNVGEGGDSPGTEGAYVEIVGGGYGPGAPEAYQRKNIRTLTWSGNETLAGNLTAAGLTDGTTTKTMTEVLAGAAIDDTTTSTTKTYSSNKISSEVGNKVDKTSNANKVYGTDASGNQTTFDKSSFGGMTAAGGYTLSFRNQTGGSFNGMVLGKWNNTYGMHIISLDDGQGTIDGVQESSPTITNASIIIPTYVYFKYYDSGVAKLYDGSDINTKALWNNAEGKMCYLYQDTTIGWSD